MKRIVLLSSVLLIVGSVGCSLLEDPEFSGGQGVVRLRFMRDAESVALGEMPQPREFIEALATADSIVVKAYPPGNGGTPEAVKGVAIPALGDTVVVSLTVIAEQNKRVAVELYAAGGLVYFGVDEDVDVRADRTTTASITTAPFEVNGFTRDIMFVAQGAAFNLMWNPVVGATSYVLQISATPDFAIVVFDTSMTDTFLAGGLPAGDYYFRVGARNVYTVSAFAPVQHVPVFGPPEIAGFDPPEVLRGDTVDVTGNDLNYPGATVTIFGKNCPIVSSSRTVLRILVPPGAHTDNITVLNTIGARGSAEKVVVQTIAYIMGDQGSGDVTAALVYKAMIDGYTGTILEGTVMIVPFTLIDFIDMGVFDVIVIGWDTGTDKSDWGGGDTARAVAIARSNAAVIGIGSGGAAYFDVVNLGIGLTNTALAVRRNVYIWDDTLPIYEQPNDIVGIGLIDIYTGAVTQYSADPSKMPPAAVVDPFALRAAGDTVYPFVDEVNQAVPKPNPNFLWGFEAPPGQLTSSGRDIFQNVVIYFMSQVAPAP